MTFDEFVKIAQGPNIEYIEDTFYFQGQEFTRDQMAWISSIFKTKVMECKCGNPKMDHIMDGERNMYWCPICGSICISPLWAGDTEYSWKLSKAVSVGWNLLDESLRKKIIDKG